MLPFRGNVALAKDAHEPPWPLWLPPLVLAAGGLLVGVAPALLNGPLSMAATATAGVSVDVSLSVWHGVTPALLLSALTFSGVAMTFARRGPLRMRSWNPRRGSEDIYHGALSALDALSRVIGPILHSASLRAYVMIIVATSLSIGGTALLMAGESDSGAKRPVSHAQPAIHGKHCAGDIPGGVGSVCEDLVANDCVYASGETVNMLVLGGFIVGDIQFAATVWTEVSAASCQ